MEAGVEDSEAVAVNLGLFCCDEGCRNSRQPFFAFQMSSHRCRSDFCS